MKVVSFNINSIRARIHQLESLIETHQPDVIGLQETKVDDAQFPLDDLAHLGYHLYYYGQKAHYGVALLTKVKAKNVIYGFPTDEPEAQRRLIGVSLPSKIGDITIINGYFPQGENQDHPIKYPAKEKFYQDLLTYIQNEKLNQHPTIIMGDLNICATDLDIGLTDINKKRWLQTRKCSFLPEEREWLNELFALNFNDVYRLHHPEETKYSWFDYRSRGFDNNIGLRIDAILSSDSLTQYCTQSEIDLEIRAMEKPSDHAPIWATFDLTK